MRGWRDFFSFVYTHPVYVRVCDSVRACRGVVVNFKCSTFLAVISEYSTVSVIFPLSSLLCSLYWPCDPLSSLESLDSCVDLGPETGRLQHV